MNLINSIVVVFALLRSSSGTILVYPLIKTLSKYYNTKCMEILFDTNIPPLYYNNLWFILKNVSSSQMTTAYLLEEYARMKIIENEPPLSRCNRPLRITYARKENQMSYEKMSRWNPSKITKPVSLVIMTESSIDNFFINATLPLHLLTLAAVMQSQELINLYAVFKVGPTHSVRIRKVGYWTPETGVFINNEIIALERLNFEGEVFRTASVESWPHVTFQGSTKENLTWDGQYIRVWREIEEIFNISSVQYEFTEEGVEKPDKRWTGMIGALLTQKVDAIVSDLTLTPERCAVMEFVNVFPFSTSHLYFKEIGSQLSWDVTLKPFECSVWWTVALLWFSFVLTLCFTIYIYEKYGIKPREYQSYLDIIFAALRSCLVQDQNPTLSTLTVRLLFATTYVTTTITLTAYSVFLIFFVSKESPLLPFEDIQGLLNDGTYKVLLHPESTFEDYFANSTDEIKREIYKRLSLPFHQHYHSNASSTGLEAVCSGQKVGLMESEQMINFRDLKALGCNLRPLIDVHLKTPQGIAFRRGSSFSDGARNFINRMRETGLIRRSLRQISRAKRSSEEVVKPIGLHQVFIIFLILLLGIIYSTSLLALEFIYHSYRKRKLASSQRLRKPV